VVARPAGAALLEAGAGAADGVVEGELLRVVSLCRLMSAAAQIAERARCERCAPERPTSLTSWPPARTARGRAGEQQIGG
jgi:hypothetical protein